MLSSDCSHTSAPSSVVHLCEVRLNAQQLRVFDLQLYIVM